MFNFYGARKRILDFQFAIAFYLFENLKIFYPPKGKCKSASAGVKLISLDHNYFCIDNENSGFTFAAVIHQKRSAENL